MKRVFVLLMIFALFSLSFSNEESVSAIITYKVEVIPAPSEKSYKEREKVSSLSNNIIPVKVRTKTTREADSINNNSTMIETVSFE